MKTLRVVLLSSLLVLVAAPAGADTIPPPDPSIIIRGGGDTTPVGLSFTFFADNQGLSVPVLSFHNVSGQNWLGLDIVTTPPFIPGDPCAPIAHSSDVFATSSCTSIGGGQVLLSFFGVGTFSNGNSNGNGPVVFPGILSGDFFTIDLGSNPALAWTANEQFDATAKVPEPATLALFLTGAGMMAARRKLWKGLHSRG